MVLNQAPQNPIDIGVPCSINEIIVEFDYKDIASESGATVSEVYKTQNLLERLGVIKAIGGRGSDIYRVGFRPFFLPIDFAYPELKKLTLDVKHSRYARIAQKIRESIVILNILEIAIKTRQSGSYILDLIELFEKHAIPYNVMQGYGKNRMDVPLKSERRVSTTLEIVSDFSHRFFAVFACNRYFLRKLLTDEKLTRERRRNFHHIPLYIFNKKENKIKSLRINRENISSIMMIFSRIFHVKFLTPKDLAEKSRLHEQRKLLKSPRKYICRVVEKTPMQKILNAWIDGYRANRGAYWSHEYQVERKAPEWFLERLRYFNSVAKACAKELGVEVKLKDVFGAAISYRALMHRGRKFQTPPATWWSSEESKGIFLRMLESYDLDEWQKTATKEDLELFEMWKNLVCREADLRGLPNPLMIGTAALHHFNEFVLFQAWITYSETHDDYKLQTRLEMDAHDYLLVNMNHILKSRFPTFEELAGQEARQRAWRTTFKNGQYRYAEKSEQISEKHLKWVN